MKNSNRLFQIQLCQYIPAVINTLVFYAKAHFLNIDLQKINISIIFYFSTKVLTTWLMIPYNYHILKGK